MNSGSMISTAGEAAGLLGGVGAVTIILTLPLWLGLVGRNILWGARTHTALASEKNWRAINRAAGRVGTLWGIAFLLIAVIVRGAVPDGLHRVVYTLLVALPVVGLCAHLVVTAVRAERPLRDHTEVDRWPDGQPQS